MEKLEVYLPENSIKIRPTEKAWVSNDIKIIDRRMKTEYNKHKKSDKLKSYNTKFKQMCEKAKHLYFKTIANDLKSLNPAQWF